MVFTSNEGKFKAGDTGTIVDFDTDGDPIFTVDGWGDVRHNYKRVVLNSMRSTASEQEQKKKAERERQEQEQKKKTERERQEQMKRQDEEKEQKMLHDSAQLVAWFKQVGFKDDPVHPQPSVKDLVYRFAKPEYAVTDLMTMFALDDEVNFRNLRLLFSHRVWIMVMFSCQ